MSYENKIIYFQNVIERNAWNLTDKIVAVPRFRDDPRYEYHYDILTEIIPTCCDLMDCCDYRCNERTFKFSMGGFYKYIDDENGVRYSDYEDINCVDGLVIIPEDEHELHIIECYYYYDEYEDFSDDYIYSMLRGGFYNYKITEEGFGYNNYEEPEWYQTGIILKADEQIPMDYYFDDYTYNDLSSGFYEEDTIYHECPPLLV